MFAVKACQEKKSRIQCEFLRQKNQSSVTVGISRKITKAPTKICPFKCKFFSAFQNNIRMFFEGQE